MEYFRLLLDWSESLILDDLLAELVMLLLKLTFISLSSMISCSSSIVFYLVLRTLMRA